MHWARKSVFGVQTKNTNHCKTNRFVSPLVVQILLNNVVKTASILLIIYSNILILSGLKFFICNSYSNIKLMLTLIHFECDQSPCGPIDSIIILLPFLLHNICTYPTLLTWIVSKKILYYNHNISLALTIIWCMADRLYIWIKSIPEALW